MGERADEVNDRGRLDAGGEFADARATRRAADVDDISGGETGEAEQLRADIEQTRAEMSETIDAIQERLSPENIKEQVMEQVGEAVQSAKDSVREATIGRVEKVMENVSESMGRAGTAVTETGSSIVETIRQNPLPAALIGLGVGMLIRNRNKGRTYGRYGSGRDYYRSDVGGYGAGRDEARYAGATSSPQPSTVERARDAVSDAADGARETASRAVSQAREQVGRLGDQVQRGARRAGDQFQTQLQENPLAVGAVALALGAAVGLAVPSTRVENEYMGEARDTLVDKAQEAARGAMGKVQQVAQDAGRSLQGDDGGQGQSG